MKLCDLKVIQTIVGEFRLSVKPSKKTPKKALFMVEKKGEDNNNIGSMWLLFNGDTLKCDDTQSQYQHFEE